MRAAALDRQITVERVANGETPSGAVTETWSTLVTLRAQRVQTSTEEFQRAFGAGTETAVVFRTRFYPGITLADRVQFEGEAFNIKELKEIGRRNGLELRCERVGT